MGGWEIERKRFGEEKEKERRKERRKIMKGIKNFNLINLYYFKKN